MAKVTAVKVNPASGDDHTILRVSSDSNSTIISTAEKGEILKVVGEEGDQYKVVVKPTSLNNVKGGSGDTGTCLANPYTYLYLDYMKKKILGKVNNGTDIQIIELADEHPGFFKVKCQTTNGMKIGYIEVRYVFRSCLEPSLEA